VFLRRRAIRLEPAFRGVSLAGFSFEHGLSPSSGEETRVATRRFRNGRAIIWAG